jgi:hypothetical protein
MRRLSLLVVLACAFTIPALAHGDMDHILGVITEIKGDSVTVTSETKATIIMLLPATTYELGSQPGRREDLRVGDRVVIHARLHEGREEAYDFRYMHPKKK